MLYNNKKSRYYIAHHAQDVYTNLGFDYRNNIFKKTIAKEILKNNINKNILLEIEKIIIYLIDSVKQIKLQYNIELNKNDRNIN